MFKPGADLRGRLLVFALTLAVPLLELSVVMAWYAYGVERLRVEDRLRDLARTTAGSADAEAVRALSVLQVLAGSSVFALVHRVHPCLDRSRGGPVNRAGQGWGPVSTPITPLRGPYSTPLNTGGAG